MADAFPSFLLLPFLFLLPASASFAGEPFSAFSVHLRKGRTGSMACMCLSQGGAHSVASITCAGEPFSAFSGSPAEEGGLAICPTEVSRRGAPSYPVGWWGQFPNIIGTFQDESRVVLFILTSLQIICSGVMFYVSAGCKQESREVQC